MLPSNPSKIMLADMLKGWLFVAMSSLLLYGLMQRVIDETSPYQAPAYPARPLGLPFILLAAIIIAVTGSLIYQTYQHHSEVERARLQAVNSLKSLLIANWLNERQNDTGFIQSSNSFANDYLAWQTTGNQQSADKLQNALNQYQLNWGYAAIALLRPNGSTLFSGDKTIEIPPQIQLTAQLAATAGKVQIINPAADSNGNYNLIFAVPLSKIPGTPPVMLLQIELSKWLKPTLKIWPAANSSGESVLFRRNGERIIYLHKLQNHPQRAQQDLTLANEKLLAAQVLRGEVALGSDVEGIDYRGAATFGEIRPIAGTDWFLLSKLDKAELYAETAQDAVPILLIGFLLLLFLGGGFYLVWQHQQLLLNHSIQQAQADRLNSLNLLAAVADSSKDVIFAKDLQGCYLFINQAAASVFGKPVAEILGRDDHAIFPAEQANRLIEISRAVITEDQIQTKEELLDTISGKRVFLATKGPLRDGNGQVIGIFGISRDVTEYKQATDKLLASEYSYRILFENMLNGYAYCQMLYADGQAKDFIYLNINKAFETLTGLYDVVGRKVSEIIPGILQSDADLIETYGRVAASGRPEHFEKYVAALQQWFLISVFSPQTGYFVAVFDVITKRKLAELQLRQSEERLQLALEAGNDGLWDWNIGCNHIYLSPYYYVMTEFKPEEVTTDFNFFKSIVHPDDWPQVLKCIEACLQNQTQFCHIEYRMITAIGEIKWILGKGKVVEYDDTGKPLRMLGTITDITARKATETAMQKQTQALAQSNMELERFNRAAVGRELDMIALKQQINALAIELKQAPPYPLAFLEHPNADDSFIQTTHQPPNTAG